MAKRLGSRISYEYNPEDGINFPKGVFAGRSLLPSYSDGTMSVSTVQPVTVTIPIGSLTINTSTTVVGSTGLTGAFQQLTLASYDEGHILVTNVAVLPPANTFAGHPSHQVTSSQGNPQIGVLQAGQTYNRMFLQFTVPIFATGASSAGNVVVTCHIMLVGAVVG